MTSEQISRARRITVAAMFAATFVVMTLLNISAQTPPQGTPPAQTPPATAPAGQGPGTAGPAAPGGGRGRGGPSPGQLLYNEQCLGCHGADAAGGRAPTLFDQKWLDSTKD